MRLDHDTQARAQRDLHRVAELGRIWSRREVDLVVADVAVGRDERYDLEPDLLERRDPLRGIGVLPLPAEIGDTQRRGRRRLHLFLRIGARARQTHHRERAQQYRRGHQPAARAGHIH